MEIEILTDPESLWNLGDRELTNVAFVALLQADAPGVDPESGFRQFYPYRVRYLRKRIKQMFEERQDDLYQKVCVEFEYCKKLKKYGKGIELLLILIDICVFIFGAGSVATLVWAFKKGFFEKLCKCNK